MWKIDNSKPALRFEIICSPNDWGKNIKKLSSQLSDTRLKQLNFWTQFQSFLEEKTELKKVFKFKIPKALPENWYTLNIITNKAFLECIVSFPKDYIRCDLHIETKELYEKLFNRKDEINKELELDLEWDESLLEKDQYNHGVKFYNKEINLSEENFEDCFKWLYEVSMRYLTIILKYLE
ncbi:DUF4268 domain-containing protein [Breznakiellaceae bacterium SP9]